MRKYLKAFSFVAVIASLFSFAAFASSQPVGDLEFIQALIASISTIKGATPIAIAVTVVQVLMLGVNTVFGSRIAGAWKLVVVSGLTFASMLLGLLKDGASLGDMLTNTALLVALQVFGNQIYQQVTKPKALI